MQSLIYSEVVNRLGLDPNKLHSNIDILYKSKVSDVDIYKVQHIGFIRC